MKIIVFIDPGVGGGAVAMDDATFKLTALYRWESDETFIEFISHVEPKMVVIEKVGGYVKGKERTGHSMFVMGENYGVQRGIIKGMGIWLMRVTPQTWMAGLGVKGIGYQPRKTKLLKLAKKIFPEQKITTHTADAAMMADYYRRAQDFIKKQSNDDIGL